MLYRRTALTCIVLVHDIYFSQCLLTRLLGSRNETVNRIDSVLAWPVVSSHSRVSSVLDWLCGRQERAPLRAGYMGHVTQIANKLHLAAQMRQEVAEHVDHSLQWLNYVNTQLLERNEVSQTSPCCVMPCHLLPCGAVRLLLLRSEADGSFAAAT